MTRSRRLEWLGAIALLLLAAWLFWRTPLAVPPGLEMDELIEAQIAEQVLDGDWRPFYEAGQGREGLYHFWLAGWLALLGQRVLTLRIASTVPTLLGLAATYSLVRRLFGPAIALITLGGAATSFWIIFSARSGLRSASLPLLAALAGYFFWRALAPLTNGRFEKDVPRRKHATYFMQAGLFLGLSFYTYTAARVLPAIFVLFAIYLFLFHRASLTDRWRGLILSALVALLVAVPLLAYLRTHPESDQFDFLDFNRPLAALERGDPEPALATTLATLGAFGVRGDPLMYDNVPGRPIFHPLGGLLFLVGAGIALVRFRQPSYAFILLWLVVSLVPGMLSQPAPNYYRMVGGQVVTFIFTALAIVEGWRYLNGRWSRLQSQNWRTATATGGLALLLVLQLAGSYRAYFTTWPNVEGIRFFWQSGLAEAGRYLDGISHSEPVALCTVLTYEHDPWWRPAWQSMPFFMQRRDLDVRYYDCRSTLVLPADQPPDPAASTSGQDQPVGRAANRDGAQYIFPDTTDPFSLIPADFQGEWLTEALPVRDAVPSREGVVLRVERLPDALGPSLGAVQWAPEAGAGVALLPIRFGDNLLLHGYQRAPGRPRPGEPLRVFTAWEVLTTPPPRLVLFTHLLSDPQTLVAQQDSLALTTDSLRPGDRFLVLHDQVWIPPDLPVSEYLLSIGIYSSDTMLRLPLFDGDQPRGDRLFLEPVKVERQ